MDIKGLINKGKDALRKNPKVIDQGADAVNKVTKNKFEGQVDKGAEAAKKFVQGDSNPDQQK